MKINVTVKPNSKKGPLVEPRADGSLIVYIRKIAAEGQANDALIKLLAKHYKTAKSNITIIRGITSRHKVLFVDGR
ncbi:MAG: DUF167 domain-containing protein [Candidatus Saccharimonadales bacterium]